MKDVLMNVLMNFFLRPFEKHSEMALKLNFENIDFLLVITWAVTYRVGVIARETYRMCYPFLSDFSYLSFFSLRNFLLRVCLRKN